MNERRRTKVLKTFLTPDRTSASNEGRELTNMSTLAGQTEVSRLPEDGIREEKRHPNLATAWNENPENLFCGIPWHSCGKSRAQLRRKNVLTTYFAAYRWSVPGELLELMDMTILPFAVYLQLVHARKNLALKRYYGAERKSHILDRSNAVERHHPISFNTEDRS
ncbi:hypothetical protein BD410DRAFT_397144 [Rickenella mellea]|uniref:Uncharacterized protein n=1 Tax=Rickenella mellea TaxID=50990 RepID=A0A4Y7PWL1_9AGAM|nr:hypothetical protein BD410DRAFT_397144 [Rickenella mellea]